MLVFWTWHFREWRFDCSNIPAKMSDIVKMQESNWCDYLLSYSSSIIYGNKQISYICRCYISGRCMDFMTKSNNSWRYIFIIHVWYESECIIYIILSTYSCSLYTEYWDSKNIEYLNMSHFYSKFSIYMEYTLLSLQTCIH